MHNSESQQVSTHIFSPGWGGRVLPYMGYTGICATQQDMLFASVTLEQGIKITLSLEEVYFSLGLTLEQGRFFPES